MPTDVVKNIKIGDVSRPIAATYDAENDTAIHSKYLKLTTFYPTNQDGTLDTSVSLYMKTADADEKYRTKEDSYTETEVDTALALKANATDVYSKTDTDALLAAKANTTDVYSKTDADSTFIKSADMYDKNTIDTNFLKVADAEGSYRKINDSYSQTDADNKFATKQDYQPKTLAQSITLDEVERTTVESAIGALVQGINGTRADLNTNYVKNENLKDSVSTAITELAEEGLIEVKTTQTKRISFRKGIQNLDLSKTDGFDQYLKIIIYDSSVSTDTISANIDLDYSEDSKSGTRTPVNAGYLKTGAKYEIYKNVLVMENNMGDKTIATSTQPQWTTFAIGTNISTEDTKFSVIIYEEGWDEKESV